MIKCWFPWRRFHHAWVITWAGGRKCTFLQSILSIVETHRSIGLVPTRRYHSIRCWKHSAISSFRNWYSIGGGGCAWSRYTSHIGWMIDFWLIVSLLNFLSEVTFIQGLHLQVVILECVKLHLKCRGELDPFFPSSWTASSTPIWWKSLAEVLYPHGSTNTPRWNWIVILLEPCLGRADWGRCVASGINFISLGKAFEIFHGACAYGHGLLPFSMLACILLTEWLDFEVVKEGKVRLWSCHWILVYSSLVGWALAFCTFWWI